MGYPVGGSQLTHPPGFVILGGDDGPFWRARMLRPGGWGSVFEPLPGDPPWPKPA